MTSKPESRGAILARVRGLCVAARILLVLLFVLTLAPIVSVTFIALFPWEGATVSAPDGWGTVIGNYVRLVLLGAAVYLGQRALGRVRRTGEPFRPEVAHDLGIAAQLVWPSSFVPGCVGLAAAAFLQAGFTGSVVDLVQLALGCVLLAVAKVFEYGCILQKQDDETL